MTGRENVTCTEEQPNPTAEQSVLPIPDETRNYLGGLAREAGFAEDAIPRFLNTVVLFGLDGSRLAEHLVRHRLTQCDMAGISRLQQGKRRGESREDYHGRSLGWRVRLHTKSEEFKVDRSFFDGDLGPEATLAEAMLYRNRHIRSPERHRARGPLTARMKKTLQSTT